MSIHCTFDICFLKLLVCRVIELPTIEDSFDDTLMPTSLNVRDQCVYIVCMCSQIVNEWFL